MLRRPHRTSRGALMAGNTQSSDPPMVKLRISSKTILARLLDFNAAATQRLSLPASMYQFVRVSASDTEDLIKFEVLTKGYKLGDAILHGSKKDVGGIGITATSVMTYIKKRRIKLLESYDLYADPKHIDTYYIHLKNTPIPDTLDLDILTWHKLLFKTKNTFPHVINIRPSSGPNLSDGYLGSTKLEFRDRNTEFIPIPKDATDLEIKPDDTIGEKLTMTFLSEMKEGTYPIGEQSYGTVTTFYSICDVEFLEMLEAYADFDLETYKKTRRGFLVLRKHPHKKDTWVIEHAFSDMEKYINHMYTKKK